MEAPTIVIIGGDAAGMSAASRARRTSQDATIVALERGQYTSYAACGLPYFIGGAVGDIDDLVSRTPEEHRAHGIDLRTGHEALDVDTRLRKVAVRGPDGDYSLALRQARTRDRGVRQVPRLREGRHGRGVHATDHPRGAGHR